MLLLYRTFERGGDFSEKLSRTATLAGAGGGSFEPSHREPFALPARRPGGRLALGDRLQTNPPVRPWQAGAAGRGVFGSVFGAAYGKARDCCLSDQRRPWNLPCDQDPDSSIRCIQLRPRSAIRAKLAVAGWTQFLRELREYASGQKMNLRDTRDHDPRLGYPSHSLRSRWARATILVREQYPPRDCSLVVTPVTTTF
jgi:hypothetical protein